MRILGISALSRDSTAALIVDGVVVATAQEERLTKQRLDSGLPKRAVRYCMDCAGLNGSEIDYVVFYEKPLRCFERVLVSQLRAFPRSARVFSRDMFSWLGERLWVRGQLAELVGVSENRIRFVDQAMSHAASAYYTSPFDAAGLLVLDDVGEWATTLLARGQGNQLEALAELHHPHSLGLLASTLTQFLGFEAGSDERLVELISAWGRPNMLSEFERLIRAQDEGRFEIDSSAFRFHFDSDVLFGLELLEHLGEHREPGGVLMMDAANRRHADLASSLQHVLEERALALCEELRRLVDCDALCIGGAVAHNTRLVARIIGEGPFKHVHLPSAPGKAGAALGAALYAQHMFEGETGATNGHMLSAEKDRVAFTATEELGSQPVEGALVFDNLASVRSEIVKRLVDGQSLAWILGASELGVRSLRSRVLLVDARLPDAHNRLLGTVMRDEPYQPACLAVSLDRAGEYVELPSSCDAHGPLTQGQVSLPATAHLREIAPSVELPDGLVNVRLVDASEEPEFAALLSEFEDASGVPLLLTASFHLRGAPIVRTEHDAHEAFLHSKLHAFFSETRGYERS